MKKAAIQVQASQHKVHKQKGKTHVAAQNMNEQGDATIRICLRTAKPPNLQRSSPISQQHPLCHHKSTSRQLSTPTAPARSPRAETLRFDEQVQLRSKGDVQDRRTGVVVEQMRRDGLALQRAPHLRTATLKHQRANL